MRHTPLLASPHPLEGLGLFLLLMQQAGVLLLDTLITFNLESDDDRYVIRFQTDLCVPVRILEGVWMGQGDIRRARGYCSGSSGIVHNSEMVDLTVIFVDYAKSIN